MNTPVKFELAKLLKEKGFDEECRLCVEDGDERPLPFNCGNTIHRNSLHPYYSAPTIAEVVMWLYENHEIWIVILPELLNGTEIRYYPSVFEQGVGEDVESYFNSPTEAYESAIEYTLNNLI